MKCGFFEKECRCKEPCIDCMKNEIIYYRKKIADMESRSNIKEGSIMITKDELMHAQAEAFTAMTIANPHTLLIGDELSKAAALTCYVLFDEKGEKK